jgi:malto-oligosyltrehalose synthase
MAELRATYRLQLNASFTLADARRRVPYFAKLGVSHLYLSPIFGARACSLHGYDVVDPTRVNPEIGGEAELRALAVELAAHDMGIIIDIVPNHMGVGAENARWEDVLTHGERSRYSQWFDIDWTDRGHGAKVVLPVLGGSLDAVLARGELSLAVRDGTTPRIQYFGQSFPIDPATLPPELQLVTFDPGAALELAESYDGQKGARKLRALLAEQHYRLIDWRRGPAEINYRRFFDVSDLVAVRVEDPGVFAESHALTLSLVREGLVDGVRVDHVDGLADPRGYLERLRAALPPGAPLFVEKILTEGEALRGDWPIDGTTGYEFLNDLEDLFIDPNGFAQIEATYRRLRRLPAGRTFRAIAHEHKRAVLTRAFGSDVTRVVELFDAAAGTDDAEPAAVRRAAIVELIASLPVYRSYLDGRSIEPADEDVIARARDAAVASVDPIVAGAIQRVVDLLLDRVEHVDPAARLRFVRRFQQLSGPAMAKGVEDTALYVYVPLASRNEVGGAPDRPLDDAVERFHRRNVENAKHWPRTLIATNTHDTKRSADVRARLDALSLAAPEWARAVRRWRKLNARHRGTVHGRLAPDTNTEYLLYQTLVALWPPPRPGRRVDDLPDRAWRDAARGRLVRYALKAAREAKTSTSWVEPDPDYEAALDAFVAAIFAPADDAPFLTDVARLVARIAPIGAANTLARVALHLTAPGTPDLYQGDEHWNFTLVDPDNRSPVDYDARIRLLEEVGASGTFSMDVRSKLHLVERLLALRRERSELFQLGDYVPLAAVGSCATQVVAFARSFGERHVLTVASRAGVAPADQSTGWGDTRLELSPPLDAVRWRQWLVPDSFVYQGSLSLSALLRTIPVAVLCG